MAYWARSLLLIAGLMGMAGVTISAAARHSGGGEVAALAGQFLVIHAAVVLAIAVGVCVGLRPAWGWLGAASCMAAGVGMFGADLAVIAFASAGPLPVAAPIGGTLMIAGWFGVVLAAAAMFRTDVSTK